jgi:hypothetical protein
VVVLRYWADMSVEQVADLLGDADLGWSRDCREADQGEGGTRCHSHQIGTVTPIVTATKAAGRVVSITGGAFGQLVLGP